jgi:hypothetical protein
MMNTISSLKNSLLSAGVALLLSACASSSSNDEMVRCNENPDIDTRCGMHNPADDPEWKEAKTVLPPLPSAENLRPIDAFEAKRGYEYLLDRASIVAGSDGVMRYTMVVRSTTGKAQMFHEGLRCQTSQVRTYAYASSSGGFRASSSTRWKPAAHSGGRGYQAYLENVIMCDHNGWAWSADKAIEALDAQFTTGGVRIERACGDLENCGDYYIRHD